MREGIDKRLSIINDISAVKFSVSSEVTTPIVYFDNVPDLSLGLCASPFTLLVPSYPVAGGRLPEIQKSLSERHRVTSPELALNPSSSIAQSLE